MDMSHCFLKYCKKDTRVKVLDTHVEVWFSSCLYNLV